MKNADSHIYLYAKGWYKKTDVIEDLKIILGERSLLYPEHVSVDDIVSVLSKIAYPYIKDEYEFARFLADILPCNSWQYGEKNEKNIELNIINKLLSVLSLTTVKEKDVVIIPLDKPDPNILPLNDILKDIICNEKEEEE